MVKNINIHDFTAVLADDILSSFYLLDADYASKNIYTSSKLSINDLSACYNTNFIKANNVVSGQWHFVSEISGNGNEVLEDRSLVPISYLAYIQSLLISEYNRLINDLFLSCKMQSYKGLVIATELSTQADVKKRFGGRTWKRIAGGRFIVGASATTAYGIPDSSKDGKDFIKLTKDQTALPKHTHDFPGGSFGGSTKVKRGNMITGTIKTTRHSTAGAARPGYSPGYLQKLMKGKILTTKQTYNFGGLECKDYSIDTAYAEHDNRPFYIPIYFWERTS